MLRRSCKSVGMVRACSKARLYNVLMANTRDKPLEMSYKYLRLVGTHQALNVFFQNAEIDLAPEIEGIGREFLHVGRVAGRIDMPLVVNFQGVQRISSALVGKLVLLHKKTRAEGVKLEFREMSDGVRAVIQKVMQPFDNDSNWGAS